MATAGCAAACLNTAGRGGLFAGQSHLNMTGNALVHAIAAGTFTNKIQTARIRKTKWFFERRDEFMSQLVREITNTIKLAKRHNLVPVFRLNGTSDIRWETIPVGGQANIMSVFPDVQFYDYSKIANRRDLPANYHLTFSLADGNDADARTALNAGMNVAVVFRTLPDQFMGHDVINGDDSDLRFLDSVIAGDTVIVGLKAKGKAKKDISGFVRN